MTDEVKRLKELREKLVAIIKRQPKNEEQRKAIETAKQHLKKINDILGDLSG